MARKILRRCAPQNDSSFVILSEAKNLPSRLRGMARKILRSEAPQNDRGGRTAPQNDREGERARHRMAAFRPLSFCPPLSFCASTPVILSEAKNLSLAAARPK